MNFLAVCRAWPLVIRSSSIVPGIGYGRPAGTAQTRNRQPPARLSRRFIGHLRRWRAADAERFGKAAIGALRIVHYYGAGIDKLRSSWRTVCTAAKLGQDVVAQKLRHTAITWSAQSGADPWELCSFYGVTMEELQAAYLHHHPGFQGSVTRAMDGR